VGDPSLWKDAVSPPVLPYACRDDGVNFEWQLMVYAQDSYVGGGGEERPPTRVRAAIASSVGPKKGLAPTFGLIPSLPSMNYCCDWAQYTQCRMGSASARASHLDTTLRLHVSKRNMVQNLWHLPRRW